MVYPKPSRPLSFRGQGQLAEVFMLFGAGRPTPVKNLLIPQAGPSLKGSP